MQGNFKYHNPTKLYFGDQSLNYLLKPEDIKEILKESL